MARQPGGRAREANENDGLILAAAREVFVANPSAPIAEVAHRAGVGMGALYRRYESKEVLLATICAEGQRVYIASAEAALASDAPPFEAYAGFMRDIVGKDTHAVSSRLAGSFQPSQIHAELGEKLQAVSDALFARVQTSGAMRKDVTLLDIGFMLEAIAQVQLGDASRTAELRQRLLALVLDSLRAEAATEPLPGRPPTWEEQNRRWVPRQ